MYMEKVWTAWRVDGISVVMFCWQMKVPVPGRVTVNRTTVHCFWASRSILGSPWTQRHTAVFLLTVCLCLCLEEQSCSGPVLSLTGELLHFSVGP